MHLFSGHRFAPSSPSRTIFCLKAVDIQATPDCRKCDNRLSQIVVSWTLLRVRRRFTGAGE